MSLSLTRFRLTAGLVLAGFLLAGAVSPVGSAEDASGTVLHLRIDAAIGPATV